MENPGFLMSFVLKTAKMKLPLHDLLIVKATAPFFLILSTYLRPLTFSLDYDIFMLSNQKGVAEHPLWMGLRASTDT